MKETGFLKKHIYHTHNRRNRNSKVDISIKYIVLIINNLRPKVQRLDASTDAFSKHLENKLCQSSTTKDENMYFLAHCLWLTLS